MLATGFAVPLIFFTITVPELDWRYMFIVPPFIVVIIVILMNLTVKNHPEEAGYSIIHDEESSTDDPHEHIPLGEIFRKITSNSIVWIVAGAYFCTGFVRKAIYAWYAIYLKEIWSVEKVGEGSAVFWWFAVVLLPVLASAGSLASGIISDKLVKGRRAPVAAVLYAVQVVFIVLAIVMSRGAFSGSVTLSLLLILGIHTGCNATHSILGTAAAMDVGGRKMAGFAAGVIDSFQYFGAMLAGFGLGSLLDAYAIPAAAAQGSAADLVMNPMIWFMSMLPFAVLGMGFMVYLWIRHGAS